MDKPSLTVTREFKARLFVYAAASAFMGSGMLLFLQTLQVFMERGGWQGIAAWLVAAASWANLSFLMSRRFITRAYNYRWYPALIPFLIALPVPVFMAVREEAFLEETAWFMVPAALVSVAAGYWLGKKAGDLKRDSSAG